MKNLPIALFFLLALLHLLGLSMEHNSLVLFTKPLLMPSLAIWFAQSTSSVSKPSFLGRAVWSALIFSTLGDVLLMFEGPLFFILGLGAFLLAHVFYIGAFASISSLKNGFLSRNPWWATPFVAFPICLLIFLWEGIPAGMKLPVAVYACVISIMALSVVNTKGKVTDLTFWTLLGGAVLFLISDSALAIGKFGQPFAGERLLIMGTYILGQYGLVRGVVKATKNV